MKTKRPSHSRRAKSLKRAPVAIFFVAGFVTLAVIAMTVRLSSPKVLPSRAASTASAITSLADTVTQTDWSGGPGQITFSDQSKFESSSNINFATPGQLSLESSPLFAPNATFSPGGAEVQVDNNTDGSYPQEGGSVAVLTNGNYVYAWPQDGCPTNCGAQFPATAVLAPDGSTVVAPFYATNTSNLSLRSDSSVAVAALTSGKFVVTWTIPDPDGPGPKNPETLFARFEANGTALDGSGIAANFCATYCSIWGHAVTSDPSGNFYIASVSGPSKLRINGFDQDRNSLFAMTGPIDGEIGSASVAVAPDGTILVTWAKTTDQRAYAARFAKPANPVDPATLVTGPYLVDLGTGYTGDAIGPYPAYAPDGTLYIAYIKHETTCGGEPGHVLITKFDESGTQVGSTFEVGTTGFADGCYWYQGPAIEFLERTGAYIVTWSEFENAGETFSGYEDIYTQYFDASDSPLSPVTLISTHVTTDEVYPSVAIDESNGRAIYVWQDWIDSSYSDGQARSVVYDIDSYLPTGTLTSSVFDAGTGKAWNTITVDQTVPSSAGNTIKVRAGNSATPDATWTGFETVTNGMAFPGTVAGYRFAQYQLNFTAGSTPIVNSVTLSTIVSPRITSDDTIGLAIEVSKTMYRTPGTADSALVGRGDLVVDEFAATSLASLVNGPVLLTPTTELDSRTLAELERVLGSKDKTIYVLGETQAVSANVVDALKNAGFKRIDRLGDDNRRSTAAKISQEVSRLQTSSPTTTAFLSEGEALVDAFSEGPAAGKKTGDGLVDYQLLNVRGSDTLDPATQEFLDVHTEITTLNLMGGVRAIPGGLEEYLRSRYPQLQINRFDGANRFDTNRKANDVFFQNPTTVYVANGQASSIPGAIQTSSATSGLGMFGALLAGTAAAQVSAPLVLTQSDVLPAESAEYFAGHAATLTSAVIIGSLSDVSQAVEDAIIALLTSN